MIRGCLIPLAWGLTALFLHAEEAAPAAIDPSSTQPAPTDLSTIRALLPSTKNSSAHAESNVPAASLPLCLQRASYLRGHNDPILAITYLRQIVTNSDLLPPQRAVAILMLADYLGEQHQEAEALSWLKIWQGLYPGRPEAGAVAYRIGTYYSNMGLPDLARDSFYMALSSTLNQGSVENPEDLKQYQRLTDATLWALSQNEYNGGKWARAAELFARFKNEATTASPLALEQASFLEADCAYQLKQLDTAQHLYEETLQKYPFNPLAPEARLHLYHIYVLQKLPERAKEELQALAWSVRTVWPKDEVYWQKRTANLLLTLNKENATILPPLLQKASQLSPESKTWQNELNHYNRLAFFKKLSSSSQSTVLSADSKEDVFSEEKNLQAMTRSLDQVLPSLSPTIQ